MLARIPLPSSGAYNITISEEPPFFWFRVAKVCTRTIYAVLKRQQARLIAEHPYQVRYLPVLYSGFFKFAFVRNPFDRLVSAWCSKVIQHNYFAFDARAQREMREFASFVKYVSQLDLEVCDPHLRLQSKLIDLNELDFLGRFENFAEDFAHVQRRLGFAPLAEHRNRSSHLDYREYYDPASRDTVQRCYARDLRIFGYRYDR
jgi:hypothetical protein